jgi:hypothetical protein
LFPPVRCQGCGATVHPPCRLCHVRAIAARQRQFEKLGRQDHCPKAG